MFMLRTTTMMWTATRHITMTHVPARKHVLCLPMQLTSIRRAFATTNLETVPLAYDLHLPNGTCIHREPRQTGYADPASTEWNNTPVVLLLHGLLGSSQNFRSVARILSKNLHARVFAIDHRNHGASPHTAIHSYQLMAADLARFIAENPFLEDRRKSTSKSIPPLHVVGHSMGGKAAVLFALYHRELLDSLLVEDISPMAQPLGREIRVCVEQLSMLAERATDIPSRAAANALISDAIPDNALRQFLLLNVRDKGGKTGIEVSVNARVLKAQFAELGRFDVDNNIMAQKTTKPPRAFLMIGSRSPLVSTQGIEAMRKLFPDVVVESVDAGHLIHSEKPQWFANRTLQWIRDSV